MEDIKFDQYREDLFRKLDFNFEEGKKMLDAGCGDGKDSEVFIKRYKLETYGIDIYENPDVKSIKGLKFTSNPRGILDLPFENEEFDYIYLHDVLHHVDEENQSYEKHIQGLHELKRVTKKGGHIIIVEGNRYNPLFYPHMVKMLGHDHFTQKYFKKIITDIWDDVEFKYFECHYYPKSVLKLFYVYEWVMERFFPKSLLSYNVAIIKNA